jgi:glucans biosynthesis protein
VAETRSGVGGVSGVEATEGKRKFVVDFRGGLLARLGGDAAVEAVTSVTGGTIDTQVLVPISDTGTWRLVLDVAAEPGAVVELAAHVAGFGRKLTEQWLYQWVVA